MSRWLTSAGVFEQDAEEKAGRAAECEPTSWKRGAIVLVAAGGLLLGWRALPTSSGPRDAVPVAPKAVEHARTGPIPSGTAEVAPPTQAQPRAVSIDKLPSVVSSPRPTVAPPSGNTARTAAPAAEEARTNHRATELELVRRARAALDTDPAQALALTSEHARAYSNGEFVQEREVLAVEALARLGRKEESLRRALELLRRFPRTPYAARLEVAVGQPIVTSDLPGSSNAGDPPHAGAAPTP
jgi:hypothetical protein